MKFNISEDWLRRMAELEDNCDVSAGGLMTVRAKFQLQEIKTYFWSPTSKTLVFRASYDQSIPEDQRFFDATPTGTFEMLVNNPTALVQFELGKFYYFDATSAAI
jgi:hypothetical protein